MSIRFRLTLLYSAILALTLIVFGTALYTIQAQETMSALQASLIQSGNGLAQSILNNYLNPSPPPKPPGPPPVPIETLSGDQAFNQLRERDIIRVLDSNGTLVASPFAGQEQDNITQALPLSADGLQALKDKQVWWETSSATGDHLLIYDIPVIYQGNVRFVVQVAQSLAQRDQALGGFEQYADHRWTFDNSDCIRHRMDSFRRDPAPHPSCYSNSASHRQGKRFHAARGLQRPKR